MLSLQAVSKSYGDKRALKDISFDIAEGEVVALLGANGSGKTTTIQAICGLIEFDSGDILFQDTSTQGKSEHLKSLGAVLDGSRNINWRLTVDQNVEYFSRIKGARYSEIKRYVAELKEKLALTEHNDKEVMKLSTGNRQKAALLCALAHSPKLLLLDEPTLGLDMQTVSEMQKIILSQAKNRNQGFLITSHDMGFIDSICSRTVVLDRGEMIFSGSVEELKKRLFQYELTIIASDSQMNEVRHHLEATGKGKWQIEKEEAQLIIQFDEVTQVLPLLAWIEAQVWSPQSIEIHQLGIEKAYRSMMNGEHKS